MIKPAKLSNKCQITIPKPVRDFLHIEGGDEILFYIEDDQVKLTNLSNIQLKLKNDKKKVEIKKEKK